MTKRVKFDILNGSGAPSHPIIYKDDGVSNLEDKLEEIQYLKDHAIAPSRLGKTILAATARLGRETTVVGRKTWSFIEPDFLKRARYGRVHADAIDDVEFAEGRSGVARRRDRRAFREKTEGEYRSRLVEAEVIEGREPSAERVRELKSENEKDVRRREIEGFNKRHEELVREKEQRERKEEERRATEAIDRENRRRRDAERYWTEKKAETRQDADDVRLALMIRREKKSDFFGKSKGDEITRDRQRTSGDERVHVISEDDLAPDTGAVKESIYITSANAAHDYNEDIPDPEVDLFIPAKHPDLEEKRAQLMDLQMRESRTRGKHIQLVRETKDISNEISINYTLRSRLLAEKKQVEREIKLLVRGQTYPIMRDARPHERASIHVLKEKLAQISKDIARVNYETAVLDDRRKETRERADEAARRWEEDKRRATLFRNELGDELSKLSVDVPAVLGRGIAKSSPSKALLSRPSDAYHSIVQKSRIEILHEESKATLKVHRDALDRDSCVWKGRHDGRKVRCEIDVLETRLATAAARLKSSADADRRSDLNDALRRFWNAGASLHEVAVAATPTTTTRPSPPPPRHRRAGDNRVLTEFVRRVRAEDSYGEGRISQLVSELVRAEAHEGDYWDSGILFGALMESQFVVPPRRIHLGGSVTVQARMVAVRRGGGAKCFKRYRKDVFVKQVRREIRRLNNMCSQGQRERRNHVNDDGSIIVSEERLQQSRIDYLERKRLQFNQEIISAKKVVGCRVEVLDGPLRGRYVVESCRVTWVENGVIPRVEHGMQRFDDRWIAVDDILFVNLEGVRYFVYGRGNVLGKKDKREEVTAVKPSYLKIPHFEKVVRSVVYDSNDRCLDSHLEKERYEIDESQQSFFDRDVTKGVYELEKRHSTKDETPTTGGDTMYSHLLALRQSDTMRKAAYHELLDKIARINIFKLRITELEENRGVLLMNRSKIVERTSYLRQIVITHERHIIKLEKDVTEAETRLKNAATAKRDYEDTLQKHEEAIIRRDTAVAAAIGVEDVAAEAIHVANKWGEDVRMTLRQRIETQQQCVKLRERCILAQMMASEAQERLNDTEGILRLLDFRKQGQPVITRFGQKRVLFCREDDMMLCVSFPLGGKLLHAKLYVPVSECLALEDNLISREQDAMEREEVDLRKYYAQEEHKRKRECNDMEKEERYIREYLHFNCVVEEEKRLREYHRRNALKNAKKRLKNKEGQNELKRRVGTVLEKKRKEEKERRKSESESQFVGKSSISRSLERLLYHRQLWKQERKSLIQYFVDKDEEILLKALEEETSKRITQEATESILATILKSFTSDIVIESLNEDREAKRRAELSTGIYFPDLPHLSLGLYNDLGHLKNRRNEELREQLIEWSIRDGEDYYIPPPRGTKDLEEIFQDLERRKREDAERKRQMQANHCMEEEEERCRRYYKEELTQALLESRLMMAEEHYMKQFLEAEERERNPPLTKYDVLGATKTGPTSNEQRRQRLKREAAERQRISKEVAKMTQEDELARSVRDEERKEEQLRLLRAEMDALNNIDNASTNNVDNVKEAEERRREYDRAHVTRTIAELEQSERQDDADICEREHSAAKQLLKSYERDTVRLGREELRAKTCAEKASAYATACLEEECEALANEVRLAAKVEETRKRSKRAAEHAEWMDTSSLNEGVTQRWKTKRLLAQLHETYFTALVDLIVSRAQVLASEKNEALLNNNIRDNRAQILAKGEGMRALWRKYRRREHLRMYRSSLGQIIFRQSRRRLLIKSLAGWKRATKWRKTVADAFELRFQTLQNASVLSSPQGRKDNNTHCRRQTLLQKHQSRNVVCQRCQNVYTEHQNHSRACQNAQFHVPPSKGDDLYLAMVQLFKEKDETMLSQLNASLEVAERGVKLGYEKNRVQLEEIAHILNTERRVVCEEFGRLKFV
mmetsp:Transcript_50466/g.60840  ORF Transcript_50466/g.60840 Transcript_50466/m.60840 type:complete len:1923 (+) Transcript_50466:192-5960(+)|eukprot:CAMPEP_0172496948 /NCGR_PEP_ID=MMETSP1066-20121228/94704_1 /TAXON_ID=671091 /ORGANISM="Coscinodiscus wailesii, Strain CCMP2513" /LENGTH=1922 /DNA_ID=CAMNT_0013269505 /DNA_START=181 /DNA_END=5949 /DNA_ORIENTATION=+